MPIRVAELPPLTLALTVACAGVSAMAATGRFSASDLALSFPLIARGQLWRLMTPFAYVDGLSMRFMAWLYFFSHFSAALESGYYAGRVHHYALALLGGLCAMLAGCLLMPDLEQPYLMTPLAFFAVQLWACSEPAQPVELFGALKTSGGMLPYWLLGAHAAIHGGEPALPAMLGMGAAVFVDCFRDDLPASYTTAAKAASAGAAAAKAALIPAVNGAADRSASVMRKRGPIIAAAIAVTLVAWQWQRGAAGVEAGSRHGMMSAQLRWAIKVEVPPVASPLSEAAGEAAAAGTDPALNGTSDALGELLARALAAAPIAAPNANASAGADEGAQGEASEALAANEGGGEESAAAQWGPRQIFALYEELSQTWRSKQKARSPKPALSSASAGGAAPRSRRADEMPADRTAESVDEMLAAMQSQLVDTLAQYDVPDSMLDAEVLVNVLGDELMDVPGYAAFAVAQQEQALAAKERADAEKQAQKEEANKQAEREEEVGTEAKPEAEAGGASEPATAEEATGTETQAKATTEAGTETGAALEIEVANATAVANVTTNETAVSTPSAELRALMDVVAEHRQHQLVAREALLAFKALVERLKLEEASLDGEEFPGLADGSSASEATAADAGAQPPAASEAAERAADLLRSLHFDTLAALEPADVRRVLNATVCSFTVPAELSDADVLSELLASAEVEPGVNGTHAIPEHHHALLHAIIAEARTGVLDRTRAAAISGLAEMLAARPPDAQVKASACVDAAGASVPCGAGVLAQAGNNSGAFNFTERTVLQAFVFDVLTAIESADNATTQQDDALLHARVLAELGIRAPTPTPVPAALTPAAAAAATPLWDDSKAEPALRNRSLALVFEAIRENGRQKGVQSALTQLRALLDGSEATTAAEEEAAAAAAEVVAAAELAATEARAAEAAVAGAGGAAAKEAEAEELEIADADEEEEEKEVGTTKVPLTASEQAAGRVVAAREAAARAKLGAREGAARAALVTHVNASLSGFDVPDHMSDREVLKELLKMAAVEPSAVASGRMELVRAAIVAHRRWLADAALAEAAAAIRVAGGGDVPAEGEGGEQNSTGAEGAQGVPASSGPWLPTLGKLRAGELLDSWKEKEAPAKGKKGAPTPPPKPAVLGAFRASPSEFSLVLAAGLLRAGFFLFFFMLWW